MNFGDATLLERALDVQAADKRSRRLRLLSTNKSDLRGRLETASAERADWSRSAPRSRFRLLARSVRCDNSPESLPLRAARSMSVLW